MSLGLVAASILMMATPVLGYTYTNSGHHYSLDIPRGWTPVSSSAFATSLSPDAMYQAPGYPSDLEFLMVIAGADPQAKNTSNYVLTSVNQFKQAFSSAAGYTVSDPQTETIGGRPAAEVTATVDIGGNGITVRMIVFSSEYYHYSYLIAYYTTTPQAQATSGTWNGLKDSFRVQGEPASPAAGPNLALVFGAVAAVAAAVVIAVAAVLSRRKRRAAQMLPPPFPGQLPYVPLTPSDVTTAPVVQQDTTGTPPPPSDERQP